MISIPRELLLALILICKEYLRVSDMFKQKRDDVNALIEGAERLYYA